MYFYIYTGKCVNVSTCVNIEIHTYIYIWYTYMVYEYIYGTYMYIEIHMYIYIYIHGIYVYIEIYKYTFIHVFQNMYVYLVCKYHLVVRLYGVAKTHRTPYGEVGGWG